MTTIISRFGMSYARAHWVRSKSILTCRGMQLKLHKPTMAIGYSLRMCARHVDSTIPGRSNLVFRSKPITEAKMSNRLIGEVMDDAFHLVVKGIISYASIRRSVSERKRQRDRQPYRHRQCFVLAARIRQWKFSHRRRLV